MNNRPILELTEENILFTTYAALAALLNNMENPDMPFYEVYQRFAAYALSKYPNLLDNYYK